ncbi:unnamed protein product [Peronospora belbahrii]|uniref:Uncharacterized protein n=1 Tax=Peronospora belbahrii TaxID=622444 RepID=A0ABN8CQ93_9STRA|nr:unnamed protein product [Peronospora belbahrii]
MGSFGKMCGRRSHRYVDRAVAHDDGKPDHEARLAQSVERKTLNLVVVGSSPTAVRGSLLGSHILWLFHILCSFGHTTDDWSYEAASKEYSAFGALSFWITMGSFGKMCGRRSHRYVDRAVAHDDGKPDHGPTGTWELRQERRVTPDVSIWCCCSVGGGVDSNGVVVVGYAVLLLLLVLLVLVVLVVPVLLLLE